MAGNERQVLKGTSSFLLDEQQKRARVYSCRTRIYSGQASALKRRLQYCRRMARSSRHWSGAAIKNYQINLADLHNLSRMVLQRSLRGQHMTRFKDARRFGRYERTELQAIAVSFAIPHDRFHKLGAILIGKDQLHVQLFT